MNLFQGAFREGLRRLLEVRQLLDDAKGAAPERTEGVEDQSRWSPMSWLILT